MNVISSCVSRTQYGVTSSKKDAWGQLLAVFINIKETVNVELIPPSPLANGRSAEYFPGTRTAVHRYGAAVRRYKGVDRGDENSTPSHAEMSQGL